jgi:YesN/AraC family two-component response regulator
VKPILFVDDESKILDGIRRMPGMDGATLLRHLRDRFPGTARIVLSGYSEVALAARAVPVAHRVLTKPCNTTELRATIERVCALQAARELLRLPDENPAC